MKVYSMFIVLCFFQVLICDNEGVTEQSLQEAFKTSLPYIKSFHPKYISLTDSILNSLQLSYTELTSSNVQFKFDEMGLLHIKFVNLKGKIKGNTITQKSKKLHWMKILAPFIAELSNIGWEETYSVKSKKNDDGKYDVRIKRITETPISYNIFKFTMYDGTDEEQIRTKVQIKNLNFTPFKNYLKKISGAILDNLQKKLNK